MNTRAGVSEIKGGNWHTCYLKYMEKYIVSFNLIKWMHPKTEYERKLVRESTRPGDGDESFQKT